MRESGMGGSGMGEVIIIFGFRIYSQKEYSIQWIHHHFSFIPEIRARFEDVR